MDFWQAYGLQLLIVAVASPAIVLLYDAARPTLLHRPTISEIVWLKLKAWRAGHGPFPWWSVLLVVGVGIAGLCGTIGLAIHFYE